MLKSYPLPQNVISFGVRAWRYMTGVLTKKENLETDMEREDDAKRHRMKTSHL